MKISSEAGKSNDLLSEKNQEMFHKFDILLKDWRSSQKPNNSQNQRRNSTGSSYGGNILASFDLLQLLENSPRELMSGLQSKISPSDAISYAKNCDPAVEEVIMERKDVIMSGKLKGRRLVFDSIEVENEVALGWDYEDTSAVVIQEREVIMNENCDGKMSRSRSCTFSGSILSEDGHGGGGEEGCGGGEPGGEKRLREAEKWPWWKVYDFGNGLVSDFVVCDHFRPNFNKVQREICAWRIGSHVNKY